MTLMPFALRLPVLSALLCLLGFATASHALVLDFASAAQLADNFSAPFTDGEVDEGFVWSAQRGFDGAAGRVEVLPSNGYGASTLFSHFTITLSHGLPTTTSFRFLGAGQTEALAARVGMGLHDEPVSLRGANTPLKTLWLQSRYNEIENTETLPQFQLGDGDGIDSVGGVLLADDHWYGIRSIWSLAEEGQGIHVFSEFLDYGSADAPLPEPQQLAQLEAVIYDVNFFDDTGVVKPLYFGLIAQNVGGGALAFDDIRIDGQLTGGVVPEGSLVSLAVAAVVTIAVAATRINARRKCAAR